MPTNEYLPVSKQDERYCDGCPCLVMDDCSAWLCSGCGDVILDDNHETPPNCPLVKFPERISSDILGLSIGDGLK